MNLRSIGCVYIQKQINQCVGTARKNGPEKYVIINTGKDYDKIYGNICTTNWKLKF